MIRKSFLLQYLVTFTIALLAMGTSCKKSDVPTTPIDDKQLYLPQVLYQNNLPADSFVYNDDNTVAKMYMYDIGTRKYYGNYEFTYDNTKRCTAVKFLANDKLVELHTLNYSNDTIRLAKTFYNGDGPENPITILLNSTKQVILSGTKDTVPRILAPNIRDVKYREYNFDGSNWTNCTYIDEFYSTYGSDIHIYKDNLKVSYTYDNKINSLGTFFSMNPIMYYYFYERKRPFISCGRNNITTVVGEREWLDGNKPGKEAISITMTYRENVTTHVLEEIRSTASTGEVSILRFKFIQAK